MIAVDQTRTTKHARYSETPAFVDSVAANVGPSRESGSIPPATMRINEMTSGIWTMRRIHCMRRPLGLVVELSKLLVHMNRGVKPIDVKIATPLSSEVFVAVSGSYICVAAKSIATCVRRQTHKIVIQIHGELRPSPWRRIK